MSTLKYSRKRGLDFLRVRPSQVGGVASDDLGVIQTFDQANSEVNPLPMSGLNQKGHPKGCPSIYLIQGLRPFDPESLRRSISES